MSKLLYQVDTTEPKIIGLNRYSRIFLVLNNNQVIVPLIKGAILYNISELPEDTVAYLYPLEDLCE